MKLKKIILWEICNDFPNQQCSSLTTFHSAGLFRASSFKTKHWSISSRSLPAQKFYDPMKCCLVEFSTSPTIFTLEHIKGVENFQFFLLICFCISFHPDSEEEGGTWTIFFLKNKNSSLKSSLSEWINSYQEFLESGDFVFTVLYPRCQVFTAREEINCMRWWMFPGGPNLLMLIMKSLHDSVSGNKAHQWAELCSIIICPTHILCKMVF